MILNKVPLRPGESFVAHVEARSIPDGKIRTSLSCIRWPQREQQQTLWTDVKVIPRYEVRGTPLVEVGGMPGSIRRRRHQRSACVRSSAMIRWVRGTFIPFSLSGAASLRITMGLVSSFSAPLPTQPQAKLREERCELGSAPGGALDQREALDKRLVASALVMQGQTGKRREGCSLDELFALVVPLCDLGPGVRRAVEEVALSQIPQLSKSRHHRGLVDK
ncbi:MAG TPA: hypothetical protein VGK04_07525 [Thermoanaerobaculia bacterium]